MADELLHLTSAEDWHAAERVGGYGQPEGGFIHLCTREQLDFVLGRHFAGRAGLVVLRLDITGSDVRWETSELGMPPFPHLYGAVAGDRSASGRASLMRVVGVTRVLNEADILEPFIRHHAALLDLHIVLDGGSTDETVDILRALHGDGVNLQLYQSSSPIFLEQVYNTGMYRLALGEGADWVLFLDADEMLVAREAERLEAILGLVPADIACLRLPVFRYAVPPAPHPLASLTRRDAKPHMYKIAARRLDPARIAIYAGNHFAFVDGRQELGLSQDRLVLAHLPERSPLQAARKAILARLKVVASGAASAAHFTTHLEDAFQRLKADPCAWLEQAGATQDAAPVEDPVPYRGGPLRYTKRPDDLARLIALFAAQAELLARSHGAILDRKRLIKRQLQDEARVAHRVF